MKTFDSVPFDYGKLKKAVAEFEQLLAKKSVLKERKDILPFFRNHLHLSCFCGLLSRQIGAAEHVAWEYELFGDFACDLVVGDWKKSSFLFVEFEDASPYSIFAKPGAKPLRDWAFRFEHGYSQIVDWFHKIHKMWENPEMEVRFGKRTINYEGALIIGRDSDLDIGEIQRLEWRKQRVVVDSRPVHCITYDELLTQMKACVAKFERAAQTVAKGKKLQ